MIRQRLLVLPVHRRSHDRYYSDQAAYVAREKVKLEATMRKPFSQLAANTRKGWELMWWWPPWEFNDLAGFVEVGLDQSGRMAGDIFLKRKHFHRDDPIRRRGTSPVASHEVLSYCEVDPVSLDGAGNAAYVSACGSIIETAQQMIRKRARTAVVSLPSYPLSCIDFVSAAKVAKPRW